MDDDPGVVTLLTRTLEGEGFRVRKAASRKEAEAALDELMNALTFLRQID